MCFSIDTDCAKKVPYFWDVLLQNGSSVALETENESYTYAELDFAAKKFSRNIPERSLIFLVCKNCLEAIVGYIGCLQKRIVPILISETINKELLGNLLDRYEPQYVWCPANFMEEDGCFSLCEYKLIRHSKSKKNLYNELALLITTSGSTGSPKFVRQSYKNIQTNTESIVEFLNIQADDRAITTMPMNYTYGLSIIQTHLMAGARLIVTNRSLFSKEFWEMLKEKRVTTFGAVPYTYQMLDRLRFLKMDLPFLKYITQAGGRLGEELHKKYAQGLREKGIGFFVMYGATEATARMSYVPAECSVEKAGSIGVAIPGGRFSLIDENETPITNPDTAGELVYCGDNVTLGYAESVEDLAKGDENQGRLNTGDMALFDKDGFFYIVGRKKRFLKLYGNRVNLVEIEDLLKNRGFECACSGEDDHMMIYTTSTELQDIVDTVSEITGINRTAFKASHIEEFPRNSAGKILYSQLR